MPPLYLYLEDLLQFSYYKYTSFLLCLQSTVSILCLMECPSCMAAKVAIIATIAMGMMCYIIVGTVNSQYLSDYLSESESDK